MVCTAIETDETDFEPEASDCESNSDCSDGEDDSEDGGSEESGGSAEDEGSAEDQNSEESGGSVEDEGSEENVAPDDKKNGSTDESESRYKLTNPCTSAVTSERTAENFFDKEIDSSTRSLVKLRRSKREKRNKFGCLK